MISHLKKERRFWKKSLVRLMQMFAFCPCQGKPSWLSYTEELGTRIVLFHGFKGTI